MDMDEMVNSCEDTCSFKDVRPLMVNEPYPPIQVQGRNRAYANLLSIDYCGSVSELSAITQYINNENRLASENCPMAKTLLGIAMAEMMHLQKLGELIALLGGNVDYIARMRNGTQRMWTPRYLTLPRNPRDMILADIQSEKDAIHQYIIHMEMIGDDCVDAVIARIIKDEEYHIVLLEDLLKEI